MNVKIKKALLLTGEIALHIGGYISDGISMSSESLSRNRDLPEDKRAAFGDFADSVHSIADSFHEHAHKLKDKRHNTDI